MPTAKPGLTAFEPTYAEKLCEIPRGSFEHLQADAGGAVYLRLSPRPVEQADRGLNAGLAQQVADGDYWLAPPSPSADVALVASGAVLPKVIEAHWQTLEDIPDAGLLVVTSVDPLFRGWIESHRQDIGAARPVAHVELLLEPLPDEAGLITVIAAHPATLSWLVSVRRQRVIRLGVDRFGHSGDPPDLYREYRLDVDANVAGIARVAMSARVCSGISPSCAEGCRYSSSTSSTRGSRCRSIPRDGACPSDFAVGV